MIITAKCQKCKKTVEPVIKSGEQGLWVVCPNCHFVIKLIKNTWEHKKV